MSYARRKVIRALLDNGCRFLREGSRHTMYISSVGGRIAVPRHSQIQRGAAQSIAAQAGIDWRIFEQAIS